ncbi:MAG: radical SAM protein [bacterium]|nr:radical SAM protein [bacterium]
MNNKVLLIQSNYHVKADSDIWAANPPLGLCYIAAVLEKENIPVEIIDADVKNLSIKRTISLIKKKKAKYVGFSILTPAADWCTEIVKQLPKSFVKIAGGPHASAVPEELLKSGFDIVVVGEGEETLLEIMQGKKLQDISGIVYRKNKKIFRNPPRGPLDPDKLPLPARYLIEKGGTNKPYFSSGTRYFPWSPIITSRGCPFNCYFCNKNIFGHRFRPRSPEKVVEEIDHLVNTYKVKELDVYDDCFNSDIKRAEKILDLIIERKYKLYLRFSNGIRADRITSKLLKKMKSAGTDYIAYGVESGDAEVLKKIPKGETLAQIRRAVRLTKEAKIPVIGFFIFGLIGDTKKSMQNTIDFAKNTGFDRAILNIATPFPGTRMWNIIKQSGGKIFIKNWKDFHNTSGKMLYEMPGTATPAEVEEMYKKAWISFYFRPKFILKQIPKLLTPSLIPMMYLGLKRILYAQKN